MDNNNGDNINIPLMPSLQRLQRELADSIIRQAPLDEIRILLACGAKVNEPVTQGMLLLLRIMHLFIYLFKKGLRPLHYATYQRYEKAVNLLLVRGCDVDAMDDVGYTALHLSAERGYNELMNLLIEHGARIKFTELRPDDKVCLEIYLFILHTIHIQTNSRLWAIHRVRPLLMNHYDWRLRMVI